MSAAAFTNSEDELPPLVENLRTWEFLWSKFYPSQVERLAFMLFGKLAAAAAAGGNCRGKFVDSRCFFVMPSKAPASLIQIPLSQLITRVWVVLNTRVTNHFSWRRSPSVSSCSLYRSPFQCGWKPLRNAVKQIISRQDSCRFFRSLHQTARKITSSLATNLKKLVIIMLLL